MEKRTKEVEILKEQLTRCQEGSKQTIDEAVRLKEENERLRKQLEKKVNEIPGYKFNVGDEVWRVKVIDNDSIECPTCKGKHYINVTVPIYGEARVECPDCESWTKIQINRNDTGSHTKSGRKYFNQIKYNKFGIERTKITGIRIYINKDGDAEVDYHISNSTTFSNGVSEKDIFAIDDKQGAEKYVSALNGEMALRASSLMCGEKAFENREGSQGVSGRS